MLVPAFLKTLRRLVPTGLTAIAGIDVLHYLSYHDVAGLSTMVPLQLAALLTLTLLLTPIAYKKMRAQRK